tara:strand:+ start:37 stop:414 length:378 start_codon:yes stop_codon:yes gene_type:complete
MRATISFEVDADKVENTMSALVSNQAPILRIAANILDNLSDGPLVTEVSEAIDLLQEASFQLEQYRDMLAGFERARFETMLPQPSDQLVNTMSELKNLKGSMEQLDAFIGKVREGDDEDVEPEEG